MGEIIIEPAAAILGSVGPTKRNVFFQIKMGNALDLLRFADDPVRHKALGVNNMWHVAKACRVGCLNAFYHCQVIKLARFCASGSHGLVAKDMRPKGESVFDGGEMCAPGRSDRDDIGPAFLQRFGPIRTPIRNRHFSRDVFDNMRRTANHAHDLCAQIPKCFGMTLSCKACSVYQDL